MPLMIRDGAKLLFVGDSITDCGRERPVGEAPGLGMGYVTIVNAALAAFHPERLIRVVNMGVSGNQARDLAARWKTDALDLAPDWLSVMIGINDVWRRFDRPARKESHVALEDYESTLDALLAAARPRLEGLVVMSPYMIEPRRDDPMRVLMDEFGAACRRLATRHGAIFVDSQAAFDAYFARRAAAGPASTGAASAAAHPMSMAWDRIHPDATGHMILARAFLDAVGIRWN